MSSMTQPEAAQVKQQIEQDHPELACELREYAGVWTVQVRNPRTRESISVVSEDDWRGRLSTLEGMEPPTHEFRP